jgi:hypothetical protein
MTAVDETLLTQAALDGELDAADMLDFENRLAGNAPLAAEYGRLKTLREVMQRELVKPLAPQALRDRVARMAAPSIAPRATRVAPPSRAMAASAVFAAGLGSAATWLALQPPIQDTYLIDTLIADHKRGLLWPALRYRIFRSSHGQTMVRDALCAGAKGAGPRNTRISAGRRQDRRHRGRAHAGPDLPAQRVFYQPDRPARAIRALRAGFCRRWLFRSGLAYPLSDIVDDFSDIISPISDTLARDRLDIVGVNRSSCWRSRVQSRARNFRSVDKIDEVGIAGIASRLCERLPGHGICEQLGKDRKSSHFLRRRFLGCNVVPLPRFEQGAMERIHSCQIEHVTDLLVRQLTLQRRLRSMSASPTP